MERKQKILYLDDEILNLKLFEMTFGKKFEVYTAADGLEGLKVLQQQSEIEAVISDMRMPNMDGYEFVMKAKREYPLIRFAILSGYEITARISEAIRSGVITEYFTKPFNRRKVEDFLVTDVKRS